MLPQSTPSGCLSTFRGVYKTLICSHAVALVRVMKESVRAEAQRPEKG
jgi:hypothetical protein